MSSFPSSVVFPMIYFYIILLLPILEARSGWTQGVGGQQTPPVEPFVNLADIPCGLTPTPPIHETLDRSDWGRIIGGRDARDGEFPWTISLQSRDGAHFCGGVILNRFHIATAAHCFIFHLYGNMDSALTETVVVAGRHDMRRESITGQRLEVEGILIHPEFSHFYPDFHNDIALIRVKTGLEWGPHVQPACLSRGSGVNGLEPESSPYSIGFVAGWGVQSKEDSDGGVLRDGRLKKVALPLWSNAECQGAYSKAGINWVTKVSHLCAGTRDGSRDSCSGDSGSALFTRSRNSSSGIVMVASGLVSGGEGCSRPAIPGIYTRISYFLPWIKSNIGNKRKFKSRNAIRK